MNFFRDDNPRMWAVLIPVMILVLGSFAILSQEKGLELLVYFNLFGIGLLGSIAFFQYLKAIKSVKAQQYVGLKGGV